VLRRLDVCDGFTHVDGDRDVFVADHERGIVHRISKR
jgi:hypothetical protein